MGALSQNDPRWSGIRLGTSEYTIGEAGCYVTSLCEIARRCGHDITPDWLNARLLELSGDGYVQGGLIARDDVLTLLFPDMQFLGSQSWYGIPTDMNFFADGNTICEIDSSPGSGIQTHFMPVVELRGGNDLLVDDSWDGVRKFASAYRGSYGVGVDNIYKGIKYAQTSTPAPQPEVIEANQRRVENEDGVNGRTAPSSSAPLAIGVDGLPREYAKGDVLTFKGYINGQDPYGNGNTVWFVGAYSDTYWYSGAFENKGVDGLDNLTPVATENPPTPEPTPSPTNPSPADSITYHFVINKKNPLPSAYVPVDLVNVGNGQQLVRDAARMLLEMQKDSGIAITLFPASGYRSYEQQEAVYNSYAPDERDTYSAKPGYSEHQTGLAIDFAPIADAFEGSAQFAWLRANAHKYGFVLRYPAGSEEITGYKFEPWHWRYIGKDALIMHESLYKTLEEFYAIAGGDYAAPVVLPQPGTVVTPTDPAQTVPSESSTPHIEAMRTLGRNGVLASISSLIAAFLDWGLLIIASRDLPPEIVVALGGVFYAALVYADRRIHQWAKENGKKIKGLIWF